MSTALLLLSFQNSYFKKKGSPKVKGAKKSVKAAAKLLAYFREHSLPIIHVLQTEKLDISAEKLLPHELMEPKFDEFTLVTPEANAFADKKLTEVLESLQVDRLLVAGIRVENQVLSTVKAAKSLGYPCAVAQDACAASSLKMNGEKFKAELVHQVVMAILHDSEVDILTTKEYIKGEEKRFKKQKKEKAQQQAIEEAAQAAFQAAQESELPKAPSRKRTKVDKKTPGSKGASPKGGKGRTNQLPANEKSSTSTEADI